MRNAGLDEAQAGIKIAGKNINNLRYADETTLMAESEEELKSLMMKAKEFQKNIYFSFIDYAKSFDCVDHNQLWNILNEMGLPDHNICLLRNLYAGQETTVRTGHGTINWFKTRKGVCQGCILSPCLFSFCAEYIT